MLIPPIHLPHFNPTTFNLLVNSRNLELWDETFALPYESILQRIHLINIVKALNLSDKMLMYARKRPV